MCLGNITKIAKLRLKFNVRIVLHISSIVLMNVLATLKGYHIESPRWKLQ